MPSETAPIEELPIAVTENGIRSIYAFDIELSQDDMGYTEPAPEHGRPAAPYDVHIYADTVTLNRRLTLPGKNLGIFARKVILSKSPVIDVSGASAKDTFKPGDRPAQTDMTPAAKGSPGANASAGGDAGTVTIVADEVVGGGSSGSFGTPSFKSPDLPSLLAAKFQQALERTPKARLDLSAILVQSSWNFQDYNPPCRFMRLKGTMQFADGVIEGINTLKVDSCRYGGDGKSLIVSLSGKGLKCTLPATFAITEIDDSRWNGKSAATPFAGEASAFQAEIQIQWDDAIAGLKPGEIKASMTLTVAQTPKVTGEFAALSGCLQHLMGSAVSAPASERLPAALKAVAELACAGVRAELDSGNPVALMVLARGGPGGRGQDGHAGVKGSKGESGSNSGTLVIEIPGRGYNAPPETAGKKGKKGGQAGDAGHSGNGGKGGEISINFMKASPVGILSFTDGGPGGDAASSGDRGQGGDGGDGGKFRVRVYNTNEGREDEGPDGPLGDPGDPAAFSGKAGDKGILGALKVNGSAPANTIPAYSYEKMAPFIKLDQLLMVQRVGKLSFLNAAEEADYARARDLFLWLCNVLPASVTTPSSQNPFTAEDCKTRAAIRASAQVELLRLVRGLDYFGHPYNWAPVLQLRHTQKRTSELINLGRIVEQQYSDYINENKSTTEKLVSLDQTVRALSADLSKAEAAEGALQRQIEMTENACASLQKDIEWQIGVMQRHKLEVEEEIRKKVSDMCNLENVVKIGSAVVAVGAGAYNGISAIAGAKEIAEIAKEAKAAMAAAGQFKDAIEKVQKSVGSLTGLASQLSLVDSAITANKPDSVKLVVAREEFEENIQPLLDEFPKKTKELRAAVRTFFDLAQARNEKILAYNALFVQKAELKTQREQIAAEIQTIQTMVREKKQTLVPASYLSFFKTALAWSKQNLVHLLYEQMRALYYHTGTQRKDLMVKISDLNIAALADTQSRLLTAYDDFLKTVGRPYAPLNDVRVTISRADHPSIFESLPTTGRITFTLEHSLAAFENMTLVKVDSVEVRLPEVHGSKGDELNLALLMMGDGAVRPVDNADDAAVVRFNCPPRPISFRYSYDPDRNDPVLQPGLIADKEFAPLSPFTTWTLDFGVKLKLNQFVGLAELQTIELHFTGHAFGRKMMKSAQRA